MSKPHWPNELTSTHRAVTAKRNWNGVSLLHKDYPSLQWRKIITLRQHGKSKATLYYTHKGFSSVKCRKYTVQRRFECVMTVKYMHNDCLSPQWRKTTKKMTGGVHVGYQLQAPCLLEGATRLDYKCRNCRSLQWRWNKQGHKSNVRNWRWTRLESSKKF